MEKSTIRTLIVVIQIILLAVQMATGNAMLCIPILLLMILVFGLKE